MSAPEASAVPPVPLVLRLLSRIPFALWYALASALAWLGSHTSAYRRQVVLDQLRASFPEMTDADLGRVCRAFYRNFADVAVELIKSPSMSPAEFERRVRFVGMEHARRHLDAGQPVILVCGHNCNWEWLLLALSCQLGYPMDAAYKPMHSAWADRALLAMRSRLGARMVPAKESFNDAIRRRAVVRAIALVSDQDPVSADFRHFTSFLGRETAFYMGPEALARAAKLPVLFLAMRRVSRGHYEATFEPLVEKGEKLPTGGVMDRYARRVEALIRERPADWLWTYKRWKVKRSVYA